jgi:hypothetical protein
LLTVLTINIIVLVLTAFFKGYGKKKGENLATKEDLKDVLDQVKQVTRTTEEIRSEISDRSWSRQKQWELKKEVILEAVKELSRLEISVLQVFAASAARQTSILPLPDSPRFNKLFDELTEVAVKMKTIAMLMDIVCSEHVVKAFRKVDTDLQAAGNDTTNIAKSIKAISEVHEAIPGKPPERKLRPVFFVHSEILIPDPSTSSCLILRLVANKLLACELQRALPK